MACDRSFRDTSSSWYTRRSVWMTKLVSRFMAWGLMTTCVVAVGPFPTSAGKMPQRPRSPMCIPVTISPGCSARSQTRSGAQMMRTCVAAERKDDRAILAATGLIDVLVEAVVAEQLERVFVMSA